MMEDLEERIEAMLKQEVDSYATVDYLAPEYQAKLAPVSELDSVLLPPTLGGSSASSSSSSSSGINEVWREKICEWSYQVIDHFDFSREVVSISIHFLDRYLATRSVNKKMFQLAAMTTLFMAIKLYERGRLSMSSMIELSRGYFKVEQMAVMELSILRALTWKMHPPTAYCFSKHFLFTLSFASIPLDVRHDILELARFLTELSVIDYYFVIHRPSSVAMAALMCAFEWVPGLSPLVSNDFLLSVRKFGLDPLGEHVSECRNRLKLLYAQGGYSRPALVSDDRNETISPVCVSYGCTPSVEPKNTSDADYNYSTTQASASN